MLDIAWVVLHRNRHIGASERRQLVPHVRFQVPFLGPESQLKSGFACAGFQIYMLFAKINAIVFLLILRFCGLIFGTARRSRKWDRENAFLLFFY